MFKIGSLRVWAWLAALPVVVACASTPEVPPVVSLDFRICTPRPDLLGAPPLELKGDNGKEVSVTLDTESPCLIASDGTRRIYAVFRLPETSEEYIISVTSVPLGHVLFSPRVQMLDFNGVVRRDLPRDSFLFHGPSLYGALRSHADERFVLITSDPQTIGSAVSRLAGSTSASAVSTGTATFMVYTGREATSVYTYAHNGKLIVAARPLPKTN